MTAARAERVAAAETVRTRVSVREIHEVSLRALRASGLSSGEAEYLAEVIASAEVHEGAGLDALATETARIPAGRVGLRLEHCDGYAVAHDPASRGPLQAFVPACETAAVVGTVVVPGMTGSPVLDWAALDIAERSGRVLSLSDGGERTVVTPSGDLLRLPAAAEPRPPVVGLVIRPLREVPDGPVISTAAERKQRHREAVAHGVSVKTPLWTLAYSIACGFLIPDHREGR
ncbi:hypothetical protein [Amycolatopsis rubida]|uniref:Uncharacterized protein n=1 Tax=Amycolatopsis rubida TaxID=112413 RepID=A0A1I5YX84_9PSEU|nr:hypothetical protein [Amycolatopsis rubida]SFQ48814.1 hypothetical protein SAMN05421854_11396 [Amycolatopsis rubida]